MAIRRANNHTKQAVGFYFIFILLPSGVSSVPFVHHLKYVPAARLTMQMPTYRAGVFNLLSSRVNLHLSYNPAGGSHCRLQNHHRYIKHHYRGMDGSPGDVGEATEGL